MPNEQWRRSDLPLSEGAEEPEGSPYLDGRIAIPAWWRRLVGMHGPRELVLRNGAPSKTYSEIDHLSAGIARGLLADGATKGTRIGILMPNGPDWIASWLAISRIGGIAVALSTFMPASELTYAVRHADISIILMADRYLRHDYNGRMEEAFPRLIEFVGERPIALADAPFLRSIWVSGEAAAWARGTLETLERTGRDSTTFGASLLEQVELEIAAADPCLMIYTSGSTALPKAIVHNSGAVVSKAEFLASSNQLVPANVSAGDRLLVTGPLFWVGGFNMLIAAMVHGAAIICVDDQSPGALLQALRRDRATHLGGRESLLRSIAALDDWTVRDFERLKAMTSKQRSYLFELKGASSLAAEQVPDVLGMTETLGPHAGVETGELRPARSRPTWGKALGRMEFKIVDLETRSPVSSGESGELLVRGPWLMDGFYKKIRSDVFDADGWYPTGDRCSIDAEGYLYFEGRLGGMIKTSGANVSPEEVEEAIRSDTDVIDVSVVPLRDAKLDQMVVAVIAAKPGSGLTEESVKARLKNEISSFKVPKRVIFLDYDALPRTPSNKISRPRLVRMLEDAFDGS